MITFKEQALKSEILKALKKLNFETLTPIQSKVIPHLLSSTKDLIALAQTGTGKTAAFSLPIVQQITPKSEAGQALILCPTRELCLQITEDIRNFASYLEGVEVVAVYGGERIEKQINALKKKCQIIVGTPGRTLDLLKRKKININKVKWFVLDEADEMLNMGFKEELDAILMNTPKEKQTLLFSATMAKSVEAIAKKYMIHPDKIAVKREETGANISHEYYMVHSKDRYKALRRIADVTPGIYGIIFCRTKAITKEIADKLIQDHYSAEAIHGDLSQDQRELVMNRFRKKQLQLLVATDVAARGIDVSDLSHIINYNLPEQSEVYVHRSGRTGRAGNKGISISIIHMKEKYRIRQIEKVLGQIFTQKQIPLGTEICEQQLFYLMEKISKTKVNEKQIEPYLGTVYEKLQSLDRDDLIKRFVGIEFSRFISFYEGAEDLNIAAQEKNNRGSKNYNRKREFVKFSKFKINIGSIDKVGPKRLITLINKNSHLRGAKIGKIEILKSCTYFEVEEEYEKSVLTLFNKMRIQGKAISIKLMKRF